MRADALALGEDLVAGDQDEVDGNTQVSSDEGGVLGLEVRKDVVVLGQGNDNAEEQGDVGAPDAERSEVGHGAVGDTLGNAGAAETDVGNEDGDPGQQTKDGGQVDKVAEDRLGVIRHVHEGQKTEAGRESESVQRDTILVGATEDGGSIAVGSQTVQRTASNVQVGVASREDKNQDTGVEDVVQGVDASDLDGNDEGRGGSVGSSGVGEDKLWGVVGHAHANQQNREDVEDEDTEEGQANGTRDRLARVLGLSDRHSDQLGSQEGKRGRDHGGPEAEELASVSSSDVGLEGTAIY